MVMCCFRTARCEALWSFALSPAWLSWARHFSMLGDAARAIEMLARAQKEGFTALSAIKRAPAFSAVREHPEFERVASEARSFEGSARRAFEEAGQEAEHHTTSNCRTIGLYHCHPCSMTLGSVAAKVRCPTHPGAA